MFIGPSKHPPYPTENAPSTEEFYRGILQKNSTEEFYRGILQRNSTEELYRGILQRNSTEELYTTNKAYRGSLHKVQLYICSVTVNMYI